MLVKATLFYFRVTTTAAVALYDVLLSGFWTYGVAAQSSSDLTDPDHLSPQPWYLEMNCKQIDQRDRGSCMFAKASFAAAVLSM